ncbi:hypothetical protein [Flavihumibacter petaseus]|uniref:Uncharacterized protein n=1 Tax=Flavihumibacter petaseus NBRC 106054 TaxID=1220578 RepID=A0A0E9N1Y1_9BACT|nr:hypothetical protein [Flavihumibacter petaseus]GAO44027.1 hypothetical protein FPE01S_03_00660 [Flavihumibacter petaseus NBRC 106054]
MRKQFLACLTACTLLFFSCSKDKPGTNLPQAPTAKAEYDHSNYGVYKGVIGRPNGIVDINLMNDGKVSAKIIIDNVTYLFTTTDLLLKDQPCVLVFHNANSYFKLYVSADGNYAAIEEFVLENYPFVKTVITKETSDAMVKRYETTYTSFSSTETYFMVLNNNKIGGLFEQNNTSTIAFTGIVSGNDILISSYNEYYLTGQTSGENISGKWDIGNSSGTWTSKRVY